MASSAAAATELDLPAGRYRISLSVETTAPALGALTLLAAGTEIAREGLAPSATSTTLAGSVQHPGGKLRVVVIADSDKSAHENAVSPDAAPSVLMSMFTVEEDRP
jgi:hypothetical protein